MPTILGANSVRDTAYNVDNSIRLDGTDDHFSLTLTQNGTSQRAFTFSCWIKRSDRNTDVPRLIHMGGTGGSPTHYISVRFRDDQSSRLSFYTEAGGSGFQLNTNRLFRDTTGWMHIVVAVNSEATNESDRQRMNVNGVEETSFSSTTAMSQNADLNHNQTNDVIYLFRKQQDTDHFPGYAAEVAFIDGQQLAPTSFGEFDEDSPTHWKPIDFKNDVTFGTNGFYIEFKDSSALGTDTSGNGNDLNPSLAGATSQSTDTCTNNFCTWSSDIPNSSSVTLSEGNLNITMGGTSRGIFGTIAVSSGKFYYEAKWVSGSFFQTGIVATSNMNDNDDVYGGKTGAFIYKSSGDIRVNGSTSTTVGSLSTGDIVGVAIDMDNGFVYFSKNGTFQNSGNPASGSSGTGGFDISANSEYVPAASPTSAVLSGNFGSPSFSISSGNSDSEGFGNFEFSVPSGYFALNTKNLAEYGG